MRYSLLLPLALLLSCASTESPTADAPTVAAGAKPVARAFDVPALLGMNADQIAQPLVSQSIRPDHDRTPRQTEGGITEASYTYWRDTTALEVSYDPATLHINSYFLKTKSGHTADLNTLLKLANVSRYDKRLNIEPVPALDNPGVYSGVKLVPAM
ncbi:MAG: hypothetical protein M3Y54_06350 [Bacteroidota bacterium]|nr:hypothetical protein [Bacteroidota bacterium]